MDLEILWNEKIFARNLCVELEVHFTTFIKDRGHFINLKKRQDVAPFKNGQE